jgi:hypothetical protein
MNNWIRHVGKRVCADVGFYYLPHRIVAVIPKTALENNTILLQKTEDQYNIYLEFHCKDGLETRPHRDLPESREETTGNLY